MLHAPQARPEARPHHSAGSEAASKAQARPHNSALNLLKGEAPNAGTEFEIAEDNEHVIWVPFEPVTADNVDNYMK